ncbi:hypothetical protein T11_1701 [Trichinella zimbabwensis]|uniref:Uncharacterized protein n=1 Tax=Trichinella zimbabwensis TaxID=268475 RepID=A0A0V1GZV6_9BILA|nr:hypothetical protein T11_1701 [Trichinella zimbabwensis]
MDMYLSLFRMAVLYGEMVLNKTNYDTKSKTLCKLSAPRHTASNIYSPLTASKSQRSSILYYFPFVYGLGPSGLFNWSIFSSLSRFVTRPCRAGRGKSWLPNFAFAC